jgi:ATP-binding cassette subfamily B protein
MWMVLLSFVGTGLVIITPIFTTKVLTDDVLIPHQHPQWIAWIVFGSILLAGLGLWITIVRGRTAAWLSVHMVYQLRKEVYAKLQLLSLSYYDKRQAGSITARVTQDVNELRNFLTDGAQYFSSWYSCCSTTGSSHYSRFCLCR